MHIRIEGAKVAPSWETLQHVVRQCLKDDQGVFTRISRKDNGCNYNACGVYDLTYRHPFKDGDTCITFEIIPEMPAKNPKGWESVDGGASIPN